METDFRTWDRETLAQFAKECWEDNLQLRQDQRMLLDRIRDLINEEMHPMPQDKTA